LRKQKRFGYGRRLASDDNPDQQSDHDDSYNHHSDHETLA